MESFKSYGLRKRSRVLVIPVLVSLGWPLALAQPSASAPAFEVATLRLADPAGSRGPGIQTTPDTLTIHGSSLMDCIQLAYQMTSTQVAGPEWLNDVHLDIVGKAAGLASETQLFSMLRPLLAERLGVMTHIERKEAQVYVLTVAKGGPKFSESTTEGPPTGRGTAGQIIYEHFAMSQLALQLSQPLGRPVVDATGLKGRYDIHMDMTSYPPSAVDQVGAMITILQEQMGLKVEGRKEAVETLVVDHAERTPTVN